MLSGIGLSHLLVTVLFFESNTIHVKNYLSHDFASPIGMLNKNLNLTTCINLNNHMFADRRLFCGHSQHTVSSCKP